MIRNTEINNKEAPKENQHGLNADDAVEKNTPKKKDGVSSLLVVKVLRGHPGRSGQTKDGKKLRSVLMREMEKKRGAQEEYRQNVRNLMKESITLQEKKQSFLERYYRKLKTGKRGGHRPIQENQIHREHINNSISGAADYMHSVSADKPQPESARVPESAVPQENSLRETGVGEGSAAPNQDPPLPEGFGDEVPAQPHIPTEEKKPTMFEGLRGVKRAEDTFAPEDRESMQRRQEEIVEKEGLRKQWETFERKRDALQGQGIRASYARSYTAGPGRSSVFQRTNMVAVVLIVIMLFALIMIIVSIAVRSDESPQIEDTAAPKPVTSTIDSERRVLIDVSTSPEDWKNISENRGSQNIVTQYIPYKIIGERNEQINLQEFSDFFEMNLPAGMLKTMHDYYFVGNYITNTNPNGLFILSVNKYNDALVWMLNWEKSAINAFYNVFPNTVRKSQPGNTSVENKIIDNKEVRILKNPESEYRLIYYFFNRSTLVFIVGNENAVPYINARIRSANAK